MVRFQFWIGMVHFLLAFWMPINNSFNKLSLFGKPFLVLVRFSELAMHGLDGVGNRHDRRRRLLILAISDRSMVS